MRTVIVAALLGALLAACGGDGETVPPPAASPTYPGSDQPELAEHAENAKQDLAQELDVPEEDLTIVLAERVTWRDGAIGCPEEGMSYTQALVEGYRIEIEHDGEPYFYHGEEGKPPFYCPNPPEDQTGARS